MITAIRPKRRLSVSREIPRSLSYRSHHFPRTRSLRFHGIHYLIPTKTRSLFTNRHIIHTRRFSTTNDGGSQPFIPSTLPVSKQSRDSLRQLEQWTIDFLNPLKTPLGTLSNWDKAMTAVESYIGDRTVRSTTTTRHIDTASRIVHRLLMEYYGKATAERRRLLEPMMRSVILSWLELSQEFPDAVMGIQKAEELCHTLEEWDLSMETERLAILNLKQQVVKTEIETKEFFHAPRLCHEIAQQLLNYGPSDEDLVSLDAAFRSAVNQTLQVAAATSDSELTSAVSQLLQRIEDMAVRGVLTRFPADELDKIIDSLYMDGTSDSSASKLSAYERKALHRRILTKISEVEDDNAETVDELIRNWRTNVQSTDIAEWKPFAQVVTNFYLRIQDPYKATKWMQIQEQIPTPEELTEALELPSRRVTHDDKDAEFEELKALEKIFSDNQKERIRQKLNLLGIWAERVRSPITPWRATEILESLENEKDASLDMTPYMTVIKLWLNETSGSTRKAIDVAMRAPTYSPELIVALGQLLQRQHESERGSATASAMKFVELVEANFDAIPDEQKIPLSETVANLLFNSIRLLQFVAFLLNRDVQFSETIAQASVSSLRNDTDKELVFKLLHNFDKLPNLDHSVYYSAIGWLLNCGDNEAFNLASQFLLKLFELRSEHAVETLQFMFEKRKSRKLSSALKFLDGIEKEILDSSAGPSASSAQGKSPIPLSFYKNFLSWAEGNHKRFSGIMERLQNHYENGWIDLHPDEEMSRKYMYSLHAVRQKVPPPFDVVKERTELLDRLIARYELTKCTESEYRPSYQMFDWIVGDLKARNKVLKDSATSASEDDPFEKDSRFVVALLEKMHKYGIAPDEKERSFVFNSAMEMVLSCRNKHMHFKTVVILKKQMEDLGIQPNIHTVLDQLRACTLASVSSHRKAYWGWHSMVVALNEARSLKAADQRVYDLCFRVMEANKNVEMIKLSKRDKILEAVTQTAILDGALNDFCRNIFTKLANDEMKRRMLVFLKTPHHNRRAAADDTLTHMLVQSVKAN